MNAEIHHLDPSPRSGQHATPQVRTLVVCDIADSTALVERMGDQNAANIIRKHDRLARALIEQHQGREIDKTDGFLLLFDRPIQAVAFALDYQRGLKHLSAAEGTVLRARVGIHMGDVVIWENAPEDVARGAKPIEVEGLVKPLAARFAQLALPQQTLVSVAAAGIARRAQRELGTETAGRVHWKEHGRYRFKGLPEPMEVVEVGEDEIAPLRAPRSGRTARKILPWYRRPFTLAAEAAMLAIGIGFGVWFLLQSPPTLAFGQRDWVVVGDLHNLTGDSVFNQSVESALRISLEQSQYVNVLPELSVQQTLQRMERNPDKTPVNRAIGSEIALRDGARALILPTLAEVGGRVRVTAEVVDPNTQTTVYSTSADGTGAQSVLPSIDKVSAQLRGKLGEAIAMVSKNSKPLEKVATSNLDALRAYSLGEHEYSQGNPKAAIPFFQQALKLDPSFALAHVALGRTYFQIDESQLAFGEIKSAESLRNRLSDRDALYADAWLANFGPQREALGKWKLLASMYPDFFPAQGTYAYFEWLYANNFDLAINAALKSASPKNPNRRTSEYVLGVLYLGVDRDKEAIKHFEEAKSLGLTPQNEYYAAAFAAMRQFNQAIATLSSGKSSGVPTNDVNVNVMRIAFLIDQGKWKEAWALIAASEQQAASITPQHVEQFEGIDYSLRSIAKFPTSKRRSMDDHTSTDFGTLLSSYLAARNGDIEFAQKILAKADPVAYSDYPTLSKLFVVVKAEVAQKTGHPDQAVDLLTPQLDGSELYITHVALMDAYAKEGDYKGALLEAHWLSTHRGRAYAEYNSEQILTPFNVAQSDLALLNAAEFSLALGDNLGAQKSLDAFRKAWPSSVDLNFLTARIAKLQAKLH